MIRARHDAGFSFTELMVVLLGAAIVAGIGVPVLGTILDSYGVVMAAQQITTELQYARMKAVSSNESFNVRFSPAEDAFQVETSAGIIHAGPFTLPAGITWNNGDGGDAIAFEGHYVTFLPTGNVPSNGAGSAGRVKIVNRGGVRIDVVVTTAGSIRATPTYRSGGAPF